MPDSLTAMILLSNACITDSKRVSILAASALNTPVSDPEQTNDVFLKVITYESAACVLRQYDSFSKSQNAEKTIISASTASFEKNKQGRSRNRQNQFSPQKLGELKARS